MALSLVILSSTRRTPVYTEVIVETSKGYGFIVCDDIKTANRILQAASHIIKGRNIEVSKALPKSGKIPEDVMSKGLRKLFVGGMTSKTDKGRMFHNSDDMISYFTQFGNVLNAYVIYDPSTKASKNFGYVEFETVAQAELVINTEDHKILGKPVTIEKQKSGITTNLQLEKRIVDQKLKRKIKGKAQEHSSIKNINSSLKQEPLHQKIDDITQSASAMKLAINFPGESIYISSRVEEGDINMLSSTSKPWLESHHAFVFNEANLDFRLEPEKSAIARDKYWRYRLQHLLAVRTSNTLCA